MTMFNYLGKWFLIVGCILFVFCSPNIAANSVYPAMQISTNSNYIPGSPHNRWSIVFLENFQYSEKAAYFEVNVNLVAYLEVGADGAIKKVKTIAVKDRLISFHDTRYSIFHIEPDKEQEIKKIIYKAAIKSEVPETLPIKELIKNTNVAVKTIPTFTPAKLNGKPVKSYYKIHLDLNLFDEK